MRASTSAALMCAGALLAGCGSSESRLPNPNRLEAQTGIARLLSAANLAFFTFAPNAPTQCSPGKLGDVEVRTCKVCAVTLYTANHGAGIWNASVRREVFDVAFKRGQSFEQPDISPASAGQGAWVSVVPPQPNQFAPPQITRTVQATIEIDYQMAANILGLTYKKGDFGSHLFFDPSGINMYSSDVPGRLRKIPTSQLVGIVGDCPKS